MSKHIKFTPEIKLDTVQPRSISLWAKTMPCLPWVAILVHESY